ncbi:hypothetical protein [Dyadobacter sediminis]|uniref:DUF3570 domain-containing protein n=1 Tax=Dyadobacter sediminis TaxID=1493691 RepID=A0A5R9KBP8_9BACT|nr:hypothetical protein [Dyadobacter sediminis]TLU92250.1 hypothetical protein FEM55_16050 [Dyadobacter sediminis]GGB96171.1 hypothetical protein GCM10011325_24360 [Dyadobacter sediminis]
MKNILNPLLFLFFYQLSYAQDSIPVTFRQETDTLAKQHFIDRYENVFMTKVPTRQMFKATAAGSEIQGSGINFGYEYKLLPSLSVEASVYSQLSPFNTGVASELLHFNWKQVNLWGNAKARWYYNMNKRIEKGLNANNFSGAYIGFTYEQSLYLRNSYSNKNTGRIGLLYGFQSRFFNHGLIDFAVGLYNKEAGQFTVFDQHQGFFRFNNFVLGTQTNIGIALGDWKKSVTSPLCDVIICDELIHDQFKIEMPNIAIGLQHQIARGSFAYERKLGDSPLSLQANLVYSFYNHNQTGFYHDRFTYASAGLEFRYYFLQNYRIRHGKAGGNFSGPYAGLKSNYGMNMYKSGSVFQPEFHRDETFRSLTHALTLGYQQRLFKRIYIDGSISYQKTRNYGFHYSGDSRPVLMSKIAVGFTF